MNALTPEEWDNLYEQYEHTRKFLDALLEQLLFHNDPQHWEAKTTKEEKS